MKNWILSLLPVFMSTSALTQEFVVPEIGIAPTGTNRSLVVKSPVGRVTVPMGYVDTNTQTYVSTAKVPLLNFGDVTDSPVSARFMDRALGQITNKLPGTPTAGVLNTSIKDIADFYAYGGRADGCGLCATHPLSSITSINGVNTTGYSLAQWQSFYSVCNDTKGRNPVTDLTNEIDEIAIQCVINKKTQEGVLWLPSGLIYQSKPILSGQYGLDVRGVGGSYSTSLVQTKRGQDAWHHGTPDTQWIDSNGVPTYFSRLGFYNIQFGCGGPGDFSNIHVCGVAIRASFNPGTAGFKLQDVNIGGRGNQSTNYWHDGIICENCSLSEFVRVGIGGINTGAGYGSLLDTGTAVAFSGKGAVQFIFRDVTTNGWNRGVTMTTGSKADADKYGNQEGFLFDNWQANQVMDALTTYNSIGDNSISPQFVVTNSQFNVCRRWFYMAQVSEVFINNNLIYGCTSGAQTGGTSNYTQYVGNVTGSGNGGSTTLNLTATAPANLAVGAPFFGRNVDVNTIVIAKNGASLTLSKALKYSTSGVQYTYGAGSAGFDAVEYMTFNNVQRLVLRDNVLAAGSSANIATFGQFLNVRDALLQNNKIQLVYNSSLSTGWYNVVGNQRVVERDSAFIGVSDGFTPVAGALNGVNEGTRFESYYTQFGTALRSDNSIQYDNSVVGTMDANKNVSVYIPPVFTVIPTSIQVTNGDMSANPTYCGLNIQATSLSNVVFTCPNGSTGSPIRLNYTLIGK